MTKTFLKPQNDLLVVEGMLSYQESARAWNTLRFQRPLLDVFPVLRERRSAPCYKWLMCHTLERLEGVMEQVRQGEMPMPLLLFLYKEETHDA